MAVSLVWLDGWVYNKKPDPRSMLRHLDPCSIPIYYNICEFGDLTWITFNLDN